jgi:DNA-binding response OmpR family regulator
MKDSAPVVLVIEDDEDIAALAAYFLRRGNYQPVMAQNGIDGLRLARELSPALILCDACLPGLNGLEVLAVLRAKPAAAHAPFVLMSGYENARGGWPMPDAFVQKPFRMEELLALVPAFVRRPQAEPSNAGQLFAAA